MTKKEAAIVSAYTGYLIGSFSEMHKYAEEKFGEPIMSHCFAYDSVAKELQEKSKEDFISITITD